MQTFESRILQSHIESFKILKNTAESWRILQILAESCRILQHLAASCSILQYLAESCLTCSFFQNFPESCKRFHSLSQKVSESCRILESLLLIIIFLWIRFEFTNNVFVKLEDYGCFSIRVDLKNGPLEKQGLRQGFYHASENINGKPTWTSTSQVLNVKITTLTKLTGFEVGIFWTSVI